MSPKGVDAPKRGYRDGQRGVSVIEMLIVLVVISILIAISVPFVARYTRMYKTEDQAVKVMDLMRESAQLAMTRRRTMRLELDSTIPGEPVARIVDENGAAADVTLKSIPLEPANLVRMDVAPNGIAMPNPPGFPAVVIAGVVSARFRSNGTVVNAGDLPISGTLVFWPPINEPNYDPGNLIPRRAEEVRAVTMDGTGGAMRLWRYDGANWVEGQ